MMEEEQDIIDGLFTNDVGEKDEFLLEVNKLLNLSSQDMYDIPIEEIAPVKTRNEDILDQRPLLSEKGNETQGIKKRDSSAQHQRKVIEEEGFDSPQRNLSQDAVDSIYRNHNNRKESTLFEQLIVNTSSQRESIVFDERELAASTKANCLLETLRNIESSFGQIPNLKEMLRDVERVAYESDKRMAVEPAKCKKVRRTLSQEEVHGYIKFHQPIRDLRNRLSRSASNIGKLSQKKGATLLIEAFKYIGEKVEVIDTEVELQIPGFEEEREGKLIEVIDCKVEHKKKTMISAIYDKGTVLEIVVFNTILKILSERFFAAIKNEIATKQLNQGEAFLEKVKVYIPEEKKEVTLEQVNDQSDSSFDSNLRMEDILDRKDDQLLLNFENLWDIEMENLFEMVERLFVRFPKINSIRLEELLRRTDFYYYEEGTRQLVNASYRIMLNYLQSVKIAEIWILRIKEDEESFKTQLILESKVSGTKSPMKIIEYHDISMLMFAEGVVAMSMVFDHMLEKVSMKNLIRMLRKTGEQPLLEYKPANKKNYKPVNKKSYAEMVPPNLHQEEPTNSPKRSTKPNSENKIVNEISKSRSPLPSSPARKPVYPSPPVKKPVTYSQPVHKEPTQAQVHSRPGKDYSENSIPHKKKGPSYDNYPSERYSKPQEYDHRSNSELAFPNNVSQRVIVNPNLKKNSNNANQNKEEIEEFGVLGKRKPLYAQEVRTQSKVDHPVIEILSSCKKNPNRYEEDHHPSIRESNFQKPSAGRTDRTAHLESTRLGGKYHPPQFSEDEPQSRTLHQTSARQEGIIDMKFVGYNMTGPEPEDSSRSSNSSSRQVSSSEDTTQESGLVTQEESHEVQQAREPLSFEIRFNTENSSRGSNLIDQSGSSSSFWIVIPEDEGVREEYLMCLENLTEESSLVSRELTLRSSVLMQEESEEDDSRENDGSSDLEEPKEEIVCEEISIQTSSQGGYSKSSSKEEEIMEKSLDNNQETTENSERSRIEDEEETSSETGSDEENDEDDHRKESSVLSISDNDDSQVIFQ